MKHIDRNGTEIKLGDIVVKTNSSKTISAQMAIVVDFTDSHVVICWGNGQERNYAGETMFVVMPEVVNAFKSEMQKHVIPSGKSTRKTKTKSAYYFIFSNADKTKMVAIKAEGKTEKYRWAILRTLKEIMPPKNGIWNEQNKHFVKYSVEGYGRNAEKTKGDFVWSISGASNVVCVVESKLPAGLQDSVVIDFDEAIVEQLRATYK